MIKPQDVFDTINAYAHYDYSALILVDKYHKYAEDVPYKSSCVPYDGDETVEEILNTIMSYYMGKYRAMTVYSKPQKNFGHKCGDDYVQIDNYAQISIQSNHVPNYGFPYVIRHYRSMRVRQQFLKYPYDNTKSRIDNIEYSDRSDFENEPLNGKMYATIVDAFTDAFEYIQANYKEVK